MRHHRAASSVAFIAALAVLPLAACSSGPVAEASEVNTLGWVDALNSHSSGSWEQVGTFSETVGQDVLPAFGVISPGCDEAQAELYGSIPSLAGAPYDKAIAGLSGQATGSPDQRIDATMQVVDAGSQVDSGVIELALLAVSACQGYVDGVLFGGPGFLFEGSVRMAEFPGGAALLSDDAPGGDDAGSLALAVSGNATLLATSESMNNADAQALLDALKDTVR